MLLKITNISQTKVLLKVANKSNVLINSEIILILETYPEFINTRNLCYSY